jgi:hypothetical protein
MHQLQHTLLQLPPVLNAAAAHLHGVQGGGGLDCAQSELQGLQGGMIQQHTVLQLLQLCTRQQHTCRECREGWG